MIAFAFSLSVWTIIICALGWSLWLLLPAALVLAVCCGTVGGGNKQ